MYNHVNFQQKVIQVMCLYIFLISIYFQQKAEQMLSQLNNQVQTLPSAETIPPPGFIALESTWDLKKQTRASNRVDMSQAYVPR